MGKGEKAWQKFGQTLRFHFVWILFCPILHIIFRPRYIDYQLLNKHRSGAVIIANHQSNVDPFLANIPLRRQIHYLVSDYNMRRWFARAIFSMFGSIPKSKALPDFTAIKRAFQIVKAGGMIGLFPEGQNSWNGATQPLRPETAKLIKRFGVALFMAELHGSYFVLPRWGHGLRRGPITIHYKKIYSQEEVARCSVREIAGQLEKLFSHNEYTLQQQRQAPYGGRFRAEFIEQFLFICPICRRAQTIYSRKHSVYCAHCGLLATLNQQGLFQSGGLTTFSTPYDWGQWQRTYWRTQLQPTLNKKITTPLLVDSPVRLAIGYRNRPLTHLEEGRLELYPTHLALTVSDDHPRTFVIQTIEANNVQNKEVLEFYYERALYSFWIAQKTRNAYKWNLSIDLLGEMQRHQN